MNNNMLQQFREMKAKHPDAILLFRNDNNHPATYDLFGEDANQAGEILRLTPDCSGETAFLSFNHELLDRFLPELVYKGHRRVAICEQLEDPRLSKRRIKRGEPFPA